ncbi:MAG: DUF177 domain-containing protein [Dehalococcoidia bacterium]
MQFNVATLLKEPTGATREHDIDEDVRIDGTPRHLRGHVRFDRTPDGVLVRARMSGAVGDTCSRCLEPLTMTLDIAFDEEFVAAADVSTGARLPVPEGKDEAYRIDEHHVLDVTEPVLQYWAMALPMAPVCDDACRGLCPDCGQKLTDGAPHPCSTDQLDARWEKLAQFRPR